MPLRLAFLVSGRGSNLQAVLDAGAAGALAAEVVGVFSDRPDCPALQRVPAPLRWSSTPAAHATRAAFEQAMGDALAATRPDLVVCAGYMRLLGAAFVQRFEGRMINIHPSLLPAFKGLHTHRQALAAGVGRHGASVHVVTAALDDGPVIAQSAVPVRPGDDAATLAARVLAVEHPLLVTVIDAFAQGRLRIEGGVPVLDGHPLLKPLQLECAAP